MGTASGRIIHAQDTFSSSGNLILKKLAGTSTGNILIVDTKGLVYDATNKRVGIGLQSPSSSLHVNALGAGVATLQLTNDTFTGTSSTDGALIEVNGTAMMIKQQEDYPMYFYQTTQARLQIDSDGRVSVGDNLTGAIADTQFEVIGAASGTILHAQDILRSSGSLIVDGSSVYFNSFANCTALETVSGLLTCGTDGGGSVVAGQGITVSGDVVSLSTSFSGTALEIIGTASGRILHAQDSLTSSGTLVWEGSASGASLWVSSFEGAGLTDCDASTSKVIWDDTNNKFSCSTDLNTGTTYTAAQGITLASNAFSLSTAFSGTSLEIIGTASGRILHAQDSLRSSGSLIVDGTSVYFNSFANCTALETVNGLLTCGTDGGSVVAGQGITVSGDVVSLSTSFSGTALEIIGTASGRILHAQDILRSSGTLIVQSTGLIKGNLSTRGTLSGAALTIMNGNSYFLGNLGIGTTATPDTALEIIGTASGTRLHAQDLLTASGKIVVSNLTLSTVDTLYGAYFNFTKTDGATNTADSINAQWSEMEINDADALHGHVRGIIAKSILTAGKVGNSSNIRNLYGGQFSAQMDGGSMSGALVGLDATVDHNSAAGAISDMYGMVIFVDSDSVAGVRGSGYMLYLNEGNGVDYGIYQDGTAVNVLQGKLGIGTTSRPDTLLEVAGTASGRTFFANDTLSSSGNLIVESLIKRGSGAASILAAEYQTGAYLFASGASVLALESYTQNRFGEQTIAPNILFGYKGVFDTNLYRSSGSTLRTDDQFLITTDNAFNRSALKIDTAESTTGQAVFEVFSDVTSTQNLVFKFTAGGNATADGNFTGGGADYAEYFYTSTPDLEFGEVVCIDVLKDNTVKRCTAEADSNVMGIVSSADQAAFIGNKFSGAEGFEVPGTVLVGLIGQLSTKAIVEKDDSGTGQILVIRPGDALTPSSKPGFVRRAKAGEPTVGVALSGLTKGEGRIDVLIARSNSSLAADAVSDRVLQTIQDLQIADEVQIMVDDAMEDLDLGDAVKKEFTAQLTNFDLKTNVESIVESILGKKESEGSETESGSGETTALRDITIYGSALVEADLHVSGALQSLNLEVAEDIVAGGSIHGSAIETDSGATLRGRISIEGELIINGVAYGASDPIAVAGAGGEQFVKIGTGGAVSIASLTIEDAIYVLGNATIEGFAQFLGGARVDGILTVSGTLVVSANQAGFALIPAGGTGVFIAFEPPMATQPIVTASSDSFAAHRLRAVSATGFTIEVQHPAPESIIFSWHALTAESPRTAEGLAGNIIRKIPFPVDARGYPLSSNSVWNSCIRNQVQLDQDGKPFSCSRYHVDHIWTHPDLLIEFTWRGEEKILILPDGFEVVIEEPQGQPEQPQEQDDTHQSIEAEPVPNDPVPTDPVPTDPVPTDPVPTEPTPVEAPVTE